MDPEQIEKRLALFRLREQIWQALRNTVKASGGGFAGVSYIPPMAIAAHVRGYGPFAGAEGEECFRLLEDFEGACSAAFQDQCLQPSTIAEAASNGEKVLAHIVAWSAHSPT